MIKYPPIISLETAIFLLETPRFLLETPRLWGSLMKIWGSPTKLWGSKQKYGWIYTLSSITLYFMHTILFLIGIKFGMYGGAQCACVRPPPYIWTRIQGVGGGIASLSFKFFFHGGAILKTI